MKSLLLLVVLANPCETAIPIVGGTVAPCTGILWSQDATREALRCKQVDLVVTRSELAFCNRAKDSTIRALQLRAASAEELLRVAPQPPPGWVLPTVTAGTAILGVTVGLFLSHLVTQ